MLSTILYKLYYIRQNHWRKLILKALSALEGGQMYSKTLRKIMQNYHNVSIGMYSYGGCFNPWYVRDKTTIGRYCSFAEGVSMFNRNHPVGFRSTHPFFFNKKLGIVKEDKVMKRPLVIGNDVWVGHKVMIMPSVTRVGDGAIIGAGAVVTKNVPDFAVVVGVPAQVVKYRFSPDVQQEVRDSKWWDKDIKELAGTISEFYRPLENISKEV